MLLFWAHNLNDRVETFQRKTLALSSYVSLLSDYMNITVYIFKMKPVAIYHYFTEIFFIQLST